MSTSYRFLESTDRFDEVMKIDATDESRLEGGTSRIGEAT